MKKSIVIFFALSTFFANAQLSVKEYNQDIVTRGQEPFGFIRDLLNRTDLIVFDDGMHPALEPWMFFNQLIEHPAIGEKIDILFLETLSTSAQPLVDSFLQSNTIDTTILIKEFQDDYTGVGWTFQTNIDLFKAVWKHNKNSKHQIKIVGVNPPIYWEGIHSWNDYQIFQSSLKSRDYFMYLEIAEKMDNFRSGKKAIFLTNTRHAYTNIKNKRNELLWNTGTFLRQRHPGKSYSIRVHNATLSITSVKSQSEGQRNSTEGLSQMVFTWVSPDNGRWDSAFALNKNKPVAVDLHQTSFGETYIGNPIANILEGSLMKDAYDGLIFLAPLNELHFSAKFDFIYTDKFKQELERRLRILKGNDFEAYLKRNGAPDFDSFYRKNFSASGVTKNTLLKN